MREYTVVPYHCLRTFSCQNIAVAGPIITHFEQLAAVIVSRKILALPLFVFSKYSQKQRQQQRTQTVTILPLPQAKPGAGFPFCQTRLYSSILDQQAPRHLLPVHGRCLNHLYTKSPGKHQHVPMRSVNLILCTDILLLISLSVNAPAVL